MDHITKKNLSAIHSFLQMAGFSSLDKIDEIFRYSITTDPEMTVMLGIKLPIIIPVAFTIPVELVAFHISFTLRPRWIDEKFEKILYYLTQKLHELVKTLQEQIPYKYEYELTKYTTIIHNLVEGYFPQITDSDKLHTQSERQIWKSYRAKLFKDQIMIKSFLSQFSQDISEMYEDFHLIPTEEMIPDLSLGVPHAQRNQFLLFKSEEAEDFLLAEPGCLTYARDIMYQNVWIRTGLESYTLPLWYSAFQDQSFSASYLLYDWLVYARGLLKIIFPILNNPEEFNSIDLKPFSYVHFILHFIPNHYFSGLFLPQLSYENLSTPQLSRRDFFLFDHLPKTFMEIQCISDYQQAKLAFSKGHYARAEELFLIVKKQLALDGHFLAQVAVLFKLDKIMKQRKDYIRAAKYLLEGLELAKMGTVSVDDMFQLHLNLIESYRMLNNDPEINYHKDILFRFLKSLPSSVEKQQLTLKINLELGKFELDMKQYAFALSYFREVRKIMLGFPRYEFFYYYYRAQYFHEIQKPIKKFRHLLKASEIEFPTSLEQLNVFFELGKIMVYENNKLEEGIKYLLRAIELDQNLNPQYLQIRLKCFEVLIDAYRALELSSEVEATNQKIEEIKTQLDHLS